MTLQNLVALLQEHRLSSQSDWESTDKTIAWIENHEDFAFTKANTNGHITASLLITNEEKTHVLLMFHKKLQIWIQFGGHTDGETDVYAAAIREFHEESGIQYEPHVPKKIFRVDVHSIPVHKETSEHLHHDIMFLWTIPFDTPFQRQEDEVDDIRWFPIEGIEDYIDSHMAGVVRLIR